MKFRSQETVYIPSLNAFGSIVGDDTPVIVNKFFYLILLFPEFIHGNISLIELTELQLEKQYPGT